MAVPVLNGKTQFFDASGLSLALGTVAFYVPGTTTPKDTWQDAEQTTLNDNPVLLDANGYAKIYGSGAYRQIVKDANGNVIWDQEAWANDPATAVSAFQATLATSAGAGLSGFSQSATYTASTVGKHLQAIVYVTDAPYSATGNGTTDDRSAINSAFAAGRSTAFPSGTYKIGSNITLADPIFLKGAILKPASGVTITISGSIIAPLAQIFDTSLGGTIAFDPAGDVTALPEWWGAPIGLDAYAAITAALTSGVSRVMLQRRDYLVTAAVYVPPYTTLEGAGPFWEGTQDTGTRLLGIGGSINVVQLGLTTAPSAFNDAPCGASLKNLYVARNSYTPFDAGCTGVLIGFSRNVIVENVRSVNSVYSFQLTNSIGATLINCYGGIDSVTPSSKCIPFYVNGLGALGAAGGNASVRMVRCKSNFNLGSPMTEFSHLRLDGRFTDTFVEDFETTGGSIGVEITGSNTSTVSNNDCRFDGLTLDQTTGIGVKISDVNPSGRVHLLDVYNAASGTGQNLTITNCYGSVVVEDVEFYMGGSTNTTAIAINTVNSAYVTGFVSECSGRVVDMQTVTKSYINLIPYNQTNSLTAIVQLISGCTDNVLECGANGGTGKIAVGYQSNAASNDYNEFRKTRLGRDTVTAKTSFTGGSEVHSVLEGV